MSCAYSHAAALQRDRSGSWPSQLYFAGPVPPPPGGLRTRPQWTRDVAGRAGDWRNRAQVVTDPLASAGRYMDSGTAGGVVLEFPFDARRTLRGSVPLVAYRRRPRGQALSYPLSPTPAPIWLSPTANAFLHSASSRSRRPRRCRDQEVLGRARWLLHYGPAHRYGRAPGVGDGCTG